MRKWAIEPQWPQVPKIKTLWIRFEFGANTKSDVINLKMTILKPIFGLTNPSRPFESIKSRNGVGAVTAPSKWKI